MNNKSEKIIEVNTFEQAFKILANLRDQSGKFMGGGNALVGTERYHKGKRIGVESFDRKIRYRIDCDTKVEKDINGKTVIKLVDKGVHFNYEDKDKNIKYCIVIKNAKYEDYISYIDKLNSGVQTLNNKNKKIKPRIKQGYIKDSFLIRKQHKTYPSPLNDTASKEIKDSDTQKINFKR